MKISDYIVELLKKHNVKHIFGYIGGYNADVVESIYKTEGIDFILNYHEQASAFAVNPYSIITETPTIAMSSGAPSSVNLVAGIANAYFDSNPCIFITGSPHSLGCRKDKKIRQNLFEEIDMVSMVTDITKYAVKIEHIEDIRYEFEKAFYIANEGRKGPVLIDLPYNITREEYDVSKLKGFKIPQKTNYDNIPLKEIQDILKNSKRPIILLGGGTRSNVCREKLKELLKKVQIPVVASLCGLDVLAHDNECYCGFIGHYGNRYSNLAVANCDSIIILGSRLDERQLGGYRTRLPEETKVIRVDVDKIELGRKIPETISIFSSTENFLEKFLSLDFTELDYSKWLNLIKKWQKRYPSHNYDDINLNANNFMHQISEYLSSDAIITADVGQNQMSVAQSLKLDGNRRLFNSAGYGSMGFSLPAAIGASYVTNNNSMIVSINGDGGLQMNIQELQTIKRDNLPINIIVLNNKCLGMIRKTQEKLYNANYCVSIDGYSAPNFEKIAYAYDIPYLKINSIQEYIKVKDFISNKSARFIEVCLPSIMENTPEPGDYIDKQNPLLDKNEQMLIKDEIENEI